MRVVAVFLPCTRRKALHVSFGDDERLTFMFVKTTIDFLLQVLILASVDTVMHYPRCVLSAIANDEHHDCVDSHANTHDLTEFCVHRQQRHAQGKLYDHEHDACHEPQVHSVSEHDVRDLVLHCLLNVTFPFDDALMTKLLQLRLQLRHVLVRSHHSLSTFFSHTEKILHV